MMPRYRLVFRHDRYFPQRKSRFFWCGLPTYAGAYGAVLREVALDDVALARAADLRARLTPKVEEV
jgi:hypothetical protein